MTHRHRLLAGRLAYVAVVLLATLTDLEFSGDMIAAGHRLTRAIAPSVTWADVVDGLRNVALFAGLGVVWVVTSLKGKVRDEIVWATVTGFGLSVMVEGLQVFSPVRIASIFDVTTNTVGAFIGALAIALAIAAVRGTKDAKSYLGIPAFAWALPYGGAVLCEALTPLFHSEPIRWTETGGPFVRIAHVLRDPQTFSIGELPFSDIPLYAAAGFLAVMMLAERGVATRRAWPAVAAIGSILVLGAHVLHGAYSLPIRWEDAITDVLAVAFGAWAARRWLTPLARSLRGAPRARAAITAYVALLVLWGWRPLLPETRVDLIMAQFSAGHLIPLRALSERADVFSATDVAQQFLLYLPLGAILAAWPLRLAGRWAHLWPALWTAVVVEAGHVLIVGRFLDVTKALIALAGVGVGWIVVRRSGFPVYGAAFPVRG